VGGILSQLPPRRHSRNPPFRHTIRCSFFRNYPHEGIVATSWAFDYLVAVFRNYPHEGIVATVRLNDKVERLFRNYPHEGIVATLGPEEGWQYLFRNYPHEGIVATEAQTFYPDFFFRNYPHEGIVATRVTQALGADPPRRKTPGDYALALVNLFKDHYAHLEAWRRFRWADCTSMQK
jgi:hypothetical protein